MRRRMLPIEARVKDLLDETRLAVLGAQLLLGLQYRAAFSAGFRRLPNAFQALDCAALLLILITVGLLATPSFHQIAEAGHATSRFIARASTALQAALPLLAVVLGVAIAIVLLIAPAAYHRIAAGGNPEESVLRYTAALMLPAEGLIALGLVGEAFVTVNMISGSLLLSIAVAAAAAIGFAILLYGVLAKRNNRASVPAD